MSHTIESINPADPIGQIVRHHPSTSRVFEAYGIDYCCGGGKKLDEVCYEKKVDLTRISEELAEAMTQTADTDVDVDAMSLTELVDHIESTHHAYLNRELPRLTGLIAKVVNAHGDRDLRLSVVLSQFADFASELHTHMRKEEQVLFPMIRRLENSTPNELPETLSIQWPISVMESEHRSAGESLDFLRSLMDDFTPPTWACNTYRAMVDGLKDLEHDMHTHVHAENNVLFPKALKLEATRV